MSVTPHPPLSRSSLPRTDATPPAQAGPRTAPAAEKVVAVEQALGASAVQQAAQQLWANRFAQCAGASTGDALGLTGADPEPEIGGWEDDASVLQQPQALNCGAAVAVMLGNEKGAGKTKPASSTFDRDLLDKALGRDGKAAVMVESATVDPTSKGGAHGVAVEGKDGQTLADAVGSSWEQHQTGGGSRANSNFSRESS